MSDNDECSSRNFCDSSKLTDWILDSVATCHMKTHISYFIPSSLEDTDINIEVADGNYVSEKQKGQVQIKMCDNNCDTFLAILHNVLLSPDLRGRLFCIITLMNLGHTCLFHKGFCMV